MIRPQQTTLRPARPADLRDVAELWCEAFPGSRSVEDRVRMLESGGRYGGLETVLVLRAPDGALAGAAKLYRLEGHVAGASLPMMGLAAVAVPDRLRRRGLAAHLCTAAIRVAAERGDAISVLYPFRPDYYERLGWGLVGALHDYRVATAALPASEQSAHVRPARSEDADAVAACYHRIASTANGPITRDDRVWAYRLAGLELGVEPVDEEAAWRLGERDDRQALVYDREGVTGYALLRPRRREAREKWTIEVRELLAETPDAYRGLIGYLSARADRWPRTRHFARADERFGDILRDPRPPGGGRARSLYFPTARILRGPMLRVLDVPRALRLRKWFEGGGTRPGRFRLGIADPQRPENEGPWVVELDGGRATVRPWRQQEPRADATLDTDASTFARIFAGELPPTGAVRLGRCRLAGDGRFLDRAFTTRQRFWLLDEF